jgi:hypothetical protein
VGSLLELISYGKQHVGSPGTTAGATEEQVADPVERLKKLKEMLDAGLISAGEFEAKRAEIVSKI